MQTTKSVYILDYCFWRRYYAAGKSVDWLDLIDTGCNYVRRELRHNNKHSELKSAGVILVPDAATKTAIKYVLNHNYSDSLSDENVSVVINSNINSVILTTYFIANFNSDKMTKKVINSWKKIRPDIHINRLATNQPVRLHNNQSDIIARFSFFWDADIYADRKSDTAILTTYGWSEFRLENKNKTFSTEIYSAENIDKTIESALKELQKFGTVVKIEKLAK